MKLVYQVSTTLRRSRRRAVTLRILAALSLAACSRGDNAGTSSANPSAAAEMPGDAGPRRTTGLDIVPETIRPHLPKHGVYAAGGGTSSTPWRTIVDLDANTVTTATSPAVGALYFTKLEKESTRPLTGTERAEVMRLAEKAQREPMMNITTTPTSAYNEVLVTTEGERAFYLEGYGPIRPTAAADLVVDLKTFAAY
jgi:hypothetical protein